MLTPNLANPIDVIHKLEREAHRAFHNKNYVHKSDHFYNFCITALSLKDYVFIHLGVEGRKEKQPYHDEWAAVSCLRAATEIANTSKHCVLEATPKSQGMRQTKSVVVNIYLNDEGDVIEEPEEAPDYEVTLPDSSTLLLYQFTREVIEYWKQYLNKIGVAYEAQSEHTFFGDKET